MSLLTNEKFGKTIGEYLAAKDLRPATVNNKRKLLGGFYSWLGGRPLTLENCEAYKKHLLARGLQKSTVWVTVKVLRAFLRYCYEKKYIKEDCAGQLAQLRLSKRVKDIVTAEQAEQIIIAGTSSSKYDRPRSLAAKEHGRLALRFALRSGLRISELRCFRWDEIDFDNQTFVVHSKGGNDDVLPFPADLVNEFRGINDKEGKVFKISANALNAMVHRGAKKLGIDKKMTVHTLRHIFASSLLKQGLSLQQTSRLLRHSSIAITDEVYSHFNIEDLRFALNAYHPVIHQGLTANDFYNLIASYIEKSGAMKDPRFKVLIDRSAKGLTVKVTPASDS